MCPNISGALRSRVQAKASSTGGNLSTLAATTNARASNWARLPPNGIESR